MNLGTQYRAEVVDKIYKNLFSMAGFEMLKELNVDFTFFDEGDGNANFNWFFGLISDSNNIETLSLNGLMFPFFGKSSGDMASIKDKFKNLKKCQISFHEDSHFEQYFEYTLHNSCKEYASELAKDLDETFAERTTEFRVLIRANEYENTKEGRCFQIIKMPFKNYVITRLE